MFPFCGKHPRFCPYTSSSSLSFLIQYYLDVKVTIVFQFSVMTRGLVFSKSINNDSEDIMFIHLVKLNTRKLTVVTFYLQVLKIQVIYMQISYSKLCLWMVMDSPLFPTRKLIKLTNSSFYGSSFQMIVQTYKSINSPDVRIMSLIQYYGINTPSNDIEITMNEDQFIQIPGKSLFPCRVATFCKLKFQTTELNQHINVTLLIAHFDDMISTKDCRYGGLAFFKETNHIVDICDDYGTLRPPRNIYSIHSSITIVIYAYQNDSIKAEMKVSTTRCQSIPLDICGLNRNLSLVNFSPAFRLKRKKVFLVYHIKLESCIVIQAANDLLLYRFSEEELNSRKRSCLLSMIFETIMQPNRRINYRDSLFFRIHMNIQSWVPKVPTQPTIHFLNRHVKARGMDRRVIKLFGKCRIKKYRITVYFTKNKTEMTPFLAKRGLDFYVYKGSIYEHEINIEYSTIIHQEPLLQFVSFSESGEALKETWAELNYYVLVFRMKKYMDNCFVKENGTDRKHDFMMWIIAHNRALLYKQTIGDWYIRGQVSCSEPAFFLSIAGIVFMKYVKPVKSNYTRNLDHVEVFWFNGIPNVNCAVICCLLEKNCKGNKHHTVISVKLPNSNKTMEGIMMNLTEIKTLYLILRNYEIFSGKQPPDQGKMIPDDELLYQSWTSAYLICDELGGYLPVFNSRKI